MNNKKINNGKKNIMQLKNLYKKNLNKNKIY